MSKDVHYTEAGGHRWIWGSWHCYAHNQTCNPWVPVNLDDILSPKYLRKEVGELLTQLDELRALATAVERYLAGGQTTAAAGLREFYAAREALRSRTPAP